MSNHPECLMILEVSRKQDYIFSRKELKENVRRSVEIAYVTGEDFFKKAAGEDYSDSNMVYSGGGHTVLQFDDFEQARRFAQKVSEKAMRDYEGMEIFVKLEKYDDSKTPGENLKALSAALERKKALRLSSFRTTAFGVEKLTDYFTPVRVSEKPFNGKQKDIIDPPDGYEFPRDFKDVAGQDNFLAVIHIDGNCMGKRVNRIYEDCKSWDSCVETLRNFSRGIQVAFEAAFNGMAEALPKDESAVLTKDKKRVPPLRPIILAGDDVCFVTRGKLGLECARIFLEKLSVKCNAVQPNVPYSACAGVALVHTKYPFHRAYMLAEELCSSAKRFGASLDETGGISALDWHIEFGQLRDDLEEIREDYKADDGTELTLRPVSVKSPTVQVSEERRYDFFREQCESMAKEEIGRNVWKGLRTALRQGEMKGDFYLKSRNLDRGRLFTDEKRCLYFDAIEMMDHITFLAKGDER